MSLQTINVSLIFKKNNGFRVLFFKIQQTMYKIQRENDEPLSTIHLRLVVSTSPLAARVSCAPPGQTTIKFNNASMITCS